MPDPLDGSTLAEDAQSIGQIVNAEDFDQIDEALDLSGIDDFSDGQEYKPLIGERVKIRWNDDLSGEELQGYGTVRDITVFNTYVVELERDVDGIRAGTPVEASEIAPVESVQPTGLYENNPQLAQPIPIQQEKLPSQAPQSIQELRLDTPPSYEPPRTTLKSVGGSRGGTRLGGGQISSSY